MTGSSSHKSSSGNGAHPVQSQQQSKSQMQSKSSKAGSVPGNPLASAPSSLARAPSTGISSSLTSLKKTKAGIPPPTSIKASTSSVGTPAQGSANGGSIATTEELTEQLLAKCDWKDKTIWAARQLMGGNATNGFLRATASVQRIKRQRARQTAQSKQKAEKGAGKEDGTKDKEGNQKDAGKGGKDAGKGGKEASTSGGKKREAPDQAGEEQLKKDVMNPRTAKKIKAELQAGLNWCVFLQNSIRSILFDMDPAIARHTPLPLIQGGEIPTFKETADGGKAKSNPVAAKALSAPQAVASNPISPTSSTAKTNAVSAKTTPDASLSASSPQKQQQRRGSDKATGGNKNSAPASQASPGESSGSSLRKHRKKKLPPSTEPPLDLPEFDIGGKKYSRKEHFFRIFECLRFRALKVGDFVAARVSSRDLWILARVQKDYPGFNVPPADFLKLSEARRDALFKDKVAIKDVEDKGNGGTTMVPRNLVLPLPRTFSEAADWAHRTMKKSRVYAMYPNTTSLYSATVVDNTTYCRGDDDIIVVEFDGDEAVDASGNLPKYHIPARFVTLIPREFPAAQTNSKKRKSVSQTPALPNAANNALDTPGSVKSVKSAGSLGLEDGLGGMVNSMGLDDLVTTDSLEDFGFDFSED